jgi:putative peptidoglycan lipid II flippase
MRPKSLANAALVIGASYLLSNIAGFIARMLINARFGDGIENSAFRVAFGVPDLLFNLLAGGALASAFIPTFTSRLAINETDHAWALAKRVALIVFFVMGGAALISAVFAPQLVASVVAPGFDGGGQMLVVSLMRVMLVSTVIFGVSGLLMGVLQSNDSFVAPAIAPVLYNIGMILGALFFTDTFGIRGVAFGVVLGAALHLLVQLPSLIVVSRQSSIVARQSSVISRQSSITSDIRQIISLMPFRLIGSAATYINNIVNGLLSSFISDNAFAALNNAFAIMILPQAAIAQAIGTALFPTISAHAAKGERKMFAQTLTRAINVIIALSTPAMIGLIVLGRPLIELLFQRGNFDALAAERVAVALSAFAVGLIGHCVLEIVTRAFYSLKDTRMPALFGLMSMIVNIVLSVLLLRFFEGNPFRFVALAFANSLATTFETIVLYAILVRREPNMRITPSAIALAKSLVAAIIMGVAVSLWLDIFSLGWLRTISAVIVGVTIYLVVSVLLRNEDILFGLALMRR